MSYFFIFYNFAKPLNWLVVRSIDRSINQSINQSIDRSIDLPINQPNNQLIKQPSSQSINQLVNQYINRFFDKLIKVFKNKSFKCDNIEQSSLLNLLYNYVTKTRLLCWENKVITLEEVNCIGIHCSLLFEACYLYVIFF